MPNRDKEKSRSVFEIGCPFGRLIITLIVWISIGIPAFAQAGARDELLTDRWMSIPANTEWNGAENGTSFKKLWELYHPESSNLLYGIGNSDSTRSPTQVLRKSLSSSSLLVEGEDQYASSSERPDTSNTSATPTDFWEDNSNPPKACGTCSTSPCCCEPCCPPLCGCTPCGPRNWLRSELLSLWMGGYRIPPLLTSSPAGTPGGQAGVLNQPTTTVLLGDQLIGRGTNFGARFTAGHWFDDCRTCGIQGELFGVGRDRNYSYPSPDDGSILARPFFNTDPAVNAPDAQILHLDGTAVGSMNFESSSSVLSAAPSWRKNLRCCSDPCCPGEARRIDLLLGYRYFQANEQFSAIETIEPQGATWVPGTQYILTDRIETQTDFHGLEFGANWVRQRNCWYYDLTSLIAVGTVRRQVDLFGSTQTIVPGQPDSILPGGFLVQAEEVGRRAQSNLAVLPQIRGKIGYWLRQNIQVSLGYDFLYLSSANRPDSYMNTVFDGSMLGLGSATMTGPPERPSRGLFVHGVSLGLQVTF